MILPNLLGACDSSLLQVGQNGSCHHAGLLFCRVAAHSGPQSDPGAKPGRTALLLSPDSTMQPARSRLGASTASAGPAAECLPAGLAISVERTPARQQQAAVATPARAAGRTSTAHAPSESSAPGLAGAGAASSVRPAAQHLQGEAAAEVVPGPARLAAEGSVGAEPQQAATGPQCAVTPEAGTGVAAVGRPASDGSADRGAAGEACRASQAAALVMTSVCSTAEAMLPKLHSQLLTRCLAMLVLGLHPGLWR